MGSDMLGSAVGVPVPELLASYAPSSWSSCFQEYEVNSFCFWCEGFPCGSARKESACNVGDLGSIPGSGRSPGEGKGCPLQHSGLENSMDCTVYGDSKESDMTERLSLTLLGGGPYSPEGAESQQA